MQTFRDLRAVDVGFAADRLPQARIQPQSGRCMPTQLRDVTSRIVDRLSAVPGVQSVGVAWSGYGSGISRTRCLAVEHYACKGDENRQVMTFSVTPDTSA